MTECTVCGGNNFEEHEGHFFCTLCSTQSQDVRVIVAEEENFENFSRTGQIKEPTTPRRNKRQAPNGDFGRPWSVYEAYQIIILHQVEALIKLGADKSLKDVVFQIWVNYLSKLRVAFSKKKDTKVTYERQRELFRGTTDKPKIKNVFAKRSLLKTRGLSAKKVRRQMEKDQTIVALQNEEFYEGDNPLSESGETERVSRGDDSDSSEVELEEDEEEKWGRYRKSLKYDSVHKVRMTSTISICYLGLMYTNPMTTVTDLIRWIRQKKIPYIDVRTILPEDMKFCLNDWQLFGFGSPPTLQQIRQTAGTIASYIDLSKFPDFPLQELVNKYIVLMDLPVEFHEYAMNLLRLMPVNLEYVPNSNKKYTIFWEGIAMAYIVILMKLIFGLTDTHEMLLSEYSKELMEFAEYGQPLFVWTDWVQHMKNKMKVRDLQETMCFDKDHTSAGMLSDRIKSTSYMCKVKLYDRTFKESIAQPIRELSQRWKSRNPEDNQSTASDHILYGNGQNDAPLDFDVNTLDDDDLLQQLDDSFRNKSNISTSANVSGINQESGLESDMRTRSIHFRKSTIQHILNPDSYLAVLHNRHEGNHSDKRMPENDEILSELLNVELYDVSSTQSKRLENSGNRVAKRRLNSDNFQNDNFAMQTRLERYRDVIEKLKEIQNNMKTTIDYETPNFCLSYDWLLKICGHFIECEMAELQETIMKMEIMYFSDSDDPSLTSLGKYHRKLLRDVYKGAGHFAKRLTGLKK